MENVLFLTLTDGMVSSFKQINIRYKLFTLKIEILVTKTTDGADCCKLLNGIEIK